MSIGFRINFSVFLSLCCGLLFLNHPSLAVYSSGMSAGMMDRLEQLRFGHTNRDLRMKERLDVLEWSVMGSRQSGTMGERLAEVQQKIDSEGSAACINTVGPTYNPAHPRTGYIAGRYTTSRDTRYAIRRTHRTRPTKVIVVARAQKKLHKPLLITGKQPVVSVLVKKGNDLYMSGDYRESIHELTRAIELNPSYAPAYVSRGYAYGKLGRTDMKKSDFQLAKRLDSRIQLPM